MYKRLHGPLGKVERAKEHVQQLGWATMAFWKTNPYVIGRRDDPETGNRHLVVESAAPIPPLMSLILGDVVHNLRSALDLLAWQLVEENGGTPNRDTAFPIYPSRDEFKAVGLRKVEGASREARDLIKAARPFKGGNDLLWQIHRLDIIDKHRLLVAVAASHENVILSFPLSKDIPQMAEVMGIKPEDFPRLDLGLVPANKSFPLKNGDVLFIADADTPEEDYPKFTIEIALYEPGIVEGEPLQTLVSQYVDAVESLIKSFVPIMGT